MTMYDWGTGPIFRPEEVPPRDKGDFDPMPAGWRRMTVTAAQRKSTKAGDGEYLQIEFTIPENDEFHGRKAWERCNLWNPSAEAVSIARRTFADLVTACGLVQVQHPDELIGRTVEVKLTVKPASGDFDARNEIKGYRPLDGVVPAPAAKPAAQAKPANPNAPSWARKPQ